MRTPKPEEIYKMAVKVVREFGESFTIPNYANYNDSKISITHQRSPFESIYIAILGRSSIQVFEMWRQIHIYREGMWITYLAELYEEALKTEQNRLKKRKESNKDNFAPIDDSDIFKGEING